MYIIALLLKASFFTKSNCFFFFTELHKWTENPSKWEEFKEYESIVKALKELLIDLYQQLPNKVPFVYRSLNHKNSKI